jgi:transketolase C-terminal domain/subunit
VDTLIVTHGRIVREALGAQKLLAEQGHCVGILLLEQLKPYGDVAREISAFLPERACKIVFLEEEIRAGGMGMMLSEAMKPYKVMENKIVRVMALDNPFAIPAKGQNCFQGAGLDGAAIACEIKQAAELSLVQK